jgi:hypothetical protein
MSGGKKKTGKTPDGVEWDPKTGEPLLADPVDTAPFNPLDTKNLGVAVAKALLEKKARPIGSLPSFRGAGIYAIYYRGNFPSYAPIALANADAKDPRWPIYIGKAIPPGGRKGSFSMEATDTTALTGRLREHAESIQLANNLDVADFVCRFLVVQDLWIPLAEQLLIVHFAPIWNRLIDGFGNHDPGAGRYNGLRPRWDVLHPGRGWAEKCRARAESATDIMREVQQYLRTAALPSLAVLGGDIVGK